MRFNRGTSAAMLSVCALMVQACETETRPVAESSSVQSSAASLPVVTAPAELKIEKNFLGISGYKLSDGTPAKITIKGNEKHSFLCRIARNSVKSVYAFRECKLNEGMTVFADPNFSSLGIPYSSATYAIDVIEKDENGNQVGSILTEKFYMSKSLDGLAVCEDSVSDEEYFRSASRLFSVRNQFGTADTKLDTNSPFKKIEYNIDTKANDKATDVREFASLRKSFKLNKAGNLILIQRTLASDDPNNNLSAKLRCSMRVPLARTMRSDEIINEDGRMYQILRAFSHGPTIVSAPMGNLYQYSYGNDVRDKEGYTGGRAKGYSFASKAKTGLQYLVDEFGYDIQLSKTDILNAKAIVMNAKGQGLVYVDGLDHPLYIKGMRGLLDSKATRAGSPSLVRPKADSSTISHVWNLSQNDDVSYIGLLNN